MDKRVWQLVGSLLIAGALWEAHKKDALWEAVVVGGGAAWAAQYISKAEAPLRPNVALPIQATTTQTDTTTTQTDTTNAQTDTTNAQTDTTNAQTDTTNKVQVQACEQACEQTDVWEDPYTSEFLLREMICEGTKSFTKQRLKVGEAKIIGCQVEEGGVISHQKSEIPTLLQIRVVLDKATTWKEMMSWLSKVGYLGFPTEFTERGYKHCPQIKCIVPKEHKGLMAIIAISENQFD